MISSPALRAFTDGDLDAVLDVWARASAVGHPFLPESFLVQERLELADRWLPASETTLAVIAGEVVGFLSLLGTEVGGLFVDPAHHRRGIGRTLLDHAKATRSSLELDVFEANTMGRRFYAAYGFRDVGRRVHEPTGQAQIRMCLP